MAFLTLALSTGSSATKASGTSPSSQYGHSLPSLGGTAKPGAVLDVRPEFIQMPAQSVGLDAQLVLKPTRRPDSFPAEGAPSAESRNACSATSAALDRTPYALGPHATATKSAK